MSQATQKADRTVETIADAGIWRTITEGVNAIRSGSGGGCEGVFEFLPDRLRVRVKDKGNIALIRQIVDAEDFEHYDVDDPFVMGINTTKFDELLGVPKSNTSPVEFNYDWDIFKFTFEANGVEYDLAGVDADSITGSPTDVPTPDAEDGYNVDVTLPVGVWERGTKVNELAGAGDGQGDFFASDENVGDFVLEGRGDDDASRVKIHEHDAFEWNEDPPEDVVESRQANSYMKSIVGLLEEDTVRFVTGPHMPYHVYTTRYDGVVDTKLMQAPRLPDK